LDATTEDIQSAAVAANCHDFISALPNAYETVVGERGVQLSGGERQRICVARAFLKNAPILILDEPTSAIDSRTEAIILDALDRLMVGRTTFIIAHRLSTVRHADKILVLDHGELVEQGSHEQLLQMNGMYRQLYEMQTTWRTRAPKLQPDIESLVLSLGGSANEVQALLSLDAILADAAGNTELANSVIDWARSYFEAEAAALMLQGNDGLTVVGSEPEGVASSAITPECAVTLATKTNEPQAVEDASEDAFMSVLAAQLHPQSQGLCLPLTNGDRATGVLALVARNGITSTPGVMQLAARSIAKALEARSQVACGSDNELQLVGPQAGGVN